MRTLTLAWRLLAGSPGLLLAAALCLGLGLAARSAIASATAAVERRLTADARSLIAGDVEVSASWKLTAAQQSAIAEVQPAGTRSTNTFQGTAMAARTTPVPAGTPSAIVATLVDLRAVDAAWPLAGRLRTAPAEAAARLGAGEAVAVVHGDLLARLGLAVGDPLRIGAATVTIVGTILSEPGVSTGFRIGPRAYLPLARLDEAGLGGADTRARRLTQFALADPDGDAGDRLAARLRQQLGLPADADRIASEGGGPMDAPVSVRSANQAAKQGARAAERIADWLRLVGVIALALGALGAGAAARGLLARQHEALATMVACGATRWRLATIICGELALLGLAGGLAGTVLGAGCGIALAATAGLPAALPGLASIASGLALGIGAALLAGLPPGLAILRQTPLAALRNEPPPPAPWTAVGVAVLGCLLLVPLAAIEARSWTIGPLVAGGIVVAGAALAGIGLAVSTLAARIPVRAWWLRRALRGDRVSALLLAVALGGATGLAALLLTVRAGLEHELDTVRRSELPGLFIIDVQGDQLEAVVARSTTVGGTVNLRPLVRARLTSIDGVSALAAPASKDRDAERAAFFRRREQNLSWRSEPGPGEAVSEGRWPAAGGEVAVEERAASRLGIGLGARLVFDVQGVELPVTVSGLRRVDWWTMQPNFLFVLGPGALEEAPAMWLGTISGITEATRRQLTAELAANHPNVTAIDVADTAVEVRKAVDSAALAVAVIAGIALAAALAVVAGTVASEARSRRLEAALIRALGARRRTLAALMATEFGLAAALAALPGAILGTAGGAVLSAQLFQVQAVIPWLWLGSAIAATIAASVIVALVTGRSAWTDPPLEVLRNG